MSGKVLLTGISGWIAKHTAIELLNSGYEVLGTVRNDSLIEQTKETISQHASIDKLSFIELDLLKDKGWDKAMEGCEFVLHVASPFVMIEPKDENEYITPAVDGTLRALKSAKKSGIKRVVLTSSMVSMLEDADKSINIDHNSWSNEKAKNISAYAKSKTLAERSAWDFIKNQNEENPLELSVVNPGPVFGPTLSGNLEGASMGMFKNMIIGKSELDITNEIIKIVNNEIKEFKIK